MQTVLDRVDAQSFGTLHNHSFSLCLVAFLVILQTHAGSFACQRQTMIGMHRISFSGPILILMAAMLIKLCVGSDTAGVALTDNKIHMSEEGTLIYGELSNGEKSQLFMDYMKKFDREVTVPCKNDFESFMSVN